MRVLIHCVLNTLHTPIVQSSNPDAKYSPFDENAKQLTCEDWPFSIFILFQLDTFHTQI